MKHSRFMNLIGLVGFVFAVSGCSLNSNVSFHDGFRGDQTNSVMPAPGLSVSNGGFFESSTAQGNKASLSMGSTTNSVREITTQGNQATLNVSGQLTQ